MCRSRAGWQEAGPGEGRGEEGAQEAGGQQEPSAIPPSAHPESQSYAYLVPLVGEAGRAGGLPGKGLFESAHLFAVHGSLHSLQPETILGCGYDSGPVR